ncbi:MAG: 3-deoxy-D-manno-octulosonic acid transferase [Acidimicrobiia bacterium]|nr:3-deoxy-D-manno-octulosonic acid transferase [Acidimicrobiia bacterium]
MYALYSVATLIAFLLASPYFLYQAVRHRKYVGSFRQRLGHLPVSFNLDRDASIWVHAVSVGEVLAARPLLVELKRRYPALKLFLSTTTRSGQQLAARGLLGVDGVFYFPFDWAFAVRRTLDVVRPRLFMMVETEIWPNLLREARQRGVRTVMVNGRISFRSYPRYRWVRPFIRRVLSDVDRFCVQGEETARRLVSLGAERSRISLTGNLKFDALDGQPHGPGPNRVLRFFRVPASRPVIVAGSTMKGEEEAVLRAFNRVRAISPRALLVIAPRHPERFADVVRLCRQEGLNTVRRTELPVDQEPNADAVVLDTIGELAQLYQIATVVFVGGSLVPAGGHNILEPAVFGRPVVFGPHMENFAEIADTFRTHEAALQVRSDRELEQAFVSVMADPVQRARLGAAAKALVEANRGAREATLGVVTSLLPAHERPRGSVVPFRGVH